MMNAFDLKRMFPEASRDFLEANADSPAPVRKKDTYAPAVLLDNKNVTTANVVAKNGGSINFVIPIEPRPIQGGKRIGINRHTGKRMIFSDKKTVAYYESVIKASSPYLPISPWEGPLHVGYGFFINRPKRLYRKTDPDNPIWCPDCKDSDNLIKGTQDALTKAGFWKSDAQIVKLEATKMYSAKGGSGSIHITIQKI